MSGQVVHFEIPADDLERAGNFYREAFGWQMSPVPGMDYTMVGTAGGDPNTTPTQPGVINGGMMKKQQPVTAPVITISVDDMDGALAQVQRLGGTITIGPQQVGSMGFAAYVTDTEGNLVGLWQSAS